MTKLESGWELLLDEEEPHSADIRSTILAAFRQLVSSLPRTTLSTSVSSSSSSSSSVIELSPIHLRSLMMLLECPCWLEVETHEVFKQLCRLLSSLSPNNQQQLIDWYVEWPSDRVEKLVGTLQQYITVSYFVDKKIRLSDIYIATKTLGYLYQANNLRATKYVGVPVLSYELWYNDVLNTDIQIIRDDFYRWKGLPLPGSTTPPSRSGESFARYPYMLDAGSKANLMRWDAQIQMQRRYNEEHMHAVLMHEATFNPYLVLKVRRDHLIPDTLQQLQSREDWDYKKPLKLVFVGESGIDEGGLRKEFFQLIVSQIFNAQFGMFYVDEESHTYKFNPTSFESTQEFELIGIVIGLAIYNAIILDLHLDSYIYSMLLGEKPTFQHLQQTHPQLARGLTQLLDFDGDVESTFLRNFTAEMDVFGEKITVELKNGGKDIPLTIQNRQEYVDLFVEWKLEKSIKKQFTAFREGFLMVCGGDALKLFRAEELQLLICGSDVVDFDALEASTRYEDGYQASTPVVRWFWEIVKTFPLTVKRKLLFFATGSDRVPIRGLSATPFIISRQCEDSDQLPTSHTCFNHLVFPEYSSKEKLQRLLLLALEHAQGFGLI